MLFFVVFSFFFFNFFLISNFIKYFNEATSEIKYSFFSTILLFLAIYISYLDLYLNLKFFFVNNNKNLKHNRLYIGTVVCNLNKYDVIF